MKEPPDIPRLVEFAEAAAYADMLRAAPVEWGCVEERTPAGWFLMAPAVDVLLFNRVLACGIDAPLERRWLQMNLDRYTAAGVLNFGIQVSPAMQPGEAVAWLGDARLLPRDNWTKVYRDRLSPPPMPQTDLRVERAFRRDRSIVARIACAGFECPRTCCRGSRRSSIGRVGITISGGGMTSLWRQRRCSSRILLPGSAWPRHFQRRVDVAGRVG
jgi:hypothetical protein